MKHTLRSSKHLIRFLENKPTERKIKPAQPLLPAQAGKAAAQQKSWAGRQNPLGRQLDLDVPGHYTELEYSLAFHLEDAQKRRVKCLLA